MDFDPGTDSELTREAVALCALAVDMLRHARHAFVSRDRSHLDAAYEMGRRLRERERVLSHRIAHRGAAVGVVLDADRQRLFVPVHLERAEGQIELLLQSIRTIVDQGVPFTDRARREIEGMFEAAIDLLLDLRDLILTHNKHLRQHVIEAGRAFVARADDCAGFHQQRLIEGVCTAAASSSYLAILDSLKGIEWHASAIAEKLERLTAADVQDIEPDTLKRVGVSATRGIGPDVRSKPSPVGWVP